MLPTISPLASVAIPTFITPYIKTFFSTALRGDIVSPQQR